jgi:biopolymer transport protein ExbD
MNPAEAKPSMPPNRRCPQCGTALKPGELAGLCPGCLLKQGAVGDTAPAAVFSPPSPDELARLFPQLEVFALIGTGGMGAVYRARQRELDRVVALKILPPGIGESPAFAERFSREARALAKLSHPGIVTIHDFGRADGLYYFVMEYVDGLNLRQLLNAGRVEPREALAIVPQICDALQYAHDHGIVHRDIKPENILLDRQGRVKVADFGLAKLMGDAEALATAPTAGAAGPAMTESGHVMGTPEYMAPEQHARPAEVDHRADIYSLGVVFYQMLTGQLPGKPIELPSKRVVIDVRLDQVVLRALEQQPARRYQQVSEVKTMVESVAATPAGGVPPEASLGLLVKGPAIGLILAGLLDVAVFGSVAVLLGWQGGSLRMHPMLASALITGLALGAFILHGGRRMMQFTGWGRSVAASIVAMVVAPGLVIGFPIGIWALVVLSRRNVREAFVARGGVGGAAAPPGLPASRGDLTWVVGTTALHAIASLVAVAFLLFGAPKCSAVAAVLDSGSAMSQPVVTSLSRSSLLGGFLLPFLWAADFGVCWLVQRFGGRKALTAWAVVGFVGLLLPVVAFQRSHRALVEAAGAPNFDLDRAASSPQELRGMRTDVVIEAGIAQPGLPWAWQELEERLKAGRFTAVDADQLVLSLAAWLRLEHPAGYRQSLSWLQRLLDALDRRDLVSEARILDFLGALHGESACDPLPRLRVGQRTVELRCQWAAPAYPAPFGMKLLNEMRTITVDHRPVQWRALSAYCDQPEFVAELNLPPLASGKHVVRCEMLSALVAEEAATDLPHKAKANEWPPSQSQRTRICSVEFDVYPEDAVLVSLSTDPALDPVASGGLTVRPVIVRAQGKGLRAVVRLDSDAIRHDSTAAFDAILRVGNQAYPCGSYSWEIRGNSRTLGGALGADLPSLDPRVREAELVLTPNVKLVESRPTIDRIWGREIVFAHVPLDRQDLAQAAQAAVFGPVIERELGGLAGNARDGLLDLDTGEIWPPPQAGLGLFGDDWRRRYQGSQTEAWIRTNGVDVALLGRGGRIIAFDCRWQTDPGGQAVRWRTTTAADLVRIAEQARASQVGPPWLTDAAAGRGFGFWFETREGSIGLGEIVSCSDTPRSVRIRYKLVQAGGGTNDSASAVGPHLDLGLLAGTLDLGTGRMRGRGLCAESFNASTTDTRTVSMTIVDTERSLRQSSDGPVGGGEKVRIPAPGESPATYLIRAENGNRGVLQVAGVEGDPSAVRVWYGFARAAESNAVAAALAQASSNAAAVAYSVEPLVQPAPGSAASVTNAPLAVQVGLARSVTVGGRDVPLSRLATELKAAALPVGTRVRVQVHRNADFRTVVAVLEALKAAGIADVEMSNQMEND